MFDPETLQILNLLRSQLAKEGKAERNAIHLLCATTKHGQEECQRLLEAARKVA